jgi:tetratricopeptide (TPR) repeat protein
METRTEIRRRLRTARDWAAVVQELEREAEVLASQERSERLVEIGLLAEEVIPDRERALGLYQRAFEANSKNIKVLGRMRAVYREMGRLELVVACGERELDGVSDAGVRGQIAAEVGESLLDMGQRDKAVPLLEQASEVLPDSMRVRDALAAANYDRDDWIAEVEKLGHLAEKADSMTAARMCLRAARILNMEMPDDPAYEQMLRRVLSNDPQNESANYLYEASLAKHERWEELAKHQEKRAYAVAEEVDRANLYRKFALEWIQRYKDRERGAAFFAKALEAAYENGADKLQGQVAAFALLREILGARKEWGKILALTDQALGAKLGDDEKLYAALLAGGIAWKELGDRDKARGYFERVKQIEPQNPVLGEFLADGGATAAGAPAATAAGAPAATAAGAAPAADPAGGGTTQVAITLPEAAGDAHAEAAPEVIGDAQKALMDTAHNAEGAGPDKAIDAWKKAVASDPSKRAPRRELARVLRKAERWNALVEALKDEESKAARTPDDKVAVLWELVDIYRDRLRLDVMVAGTLTNILNQQPDNLAVLDQLAAQYEQMKRWPDLVSTLAKKAQRLQDKGEKVALHLRVANLYLEKFSNQAEAIKAFEAALELDPDNLEAASHLKSVYEKRRDWEKLIALSRREIARVADPRERLAKTIDLAKLASEKLKKPPVSIAAWADVLTIDRDNAEALGELDKLYEREKQFDKLAEVVTRQADLAPDAARKVQFLQRLGILFGEKVGDNARAIDAWKALLAVEPDNKRAQDAVKKLYVTQKAWGELEAFFNAQGKLDEYVRVLERQVETEDDTTKIELWQKIAVLYRDQLGKPDRAMRAFERVLGLDGHNLGAAEALIPLYEGAKDPKKLAGVLEIQLERTPLAEKARRQERMKRLATLCEQQLRDKGAAFGWWLKAFEEDHTDLGTRAEVERLAKDTAGHELLVEAYERATGKIAVPGDAHPLMAVVARVQEHDLADTDRALETNRKILAHAPDDRDAIDALERLYLAKQRYPELLAIYDKKLALGADPEARKEIQYKVGQLYEEEIGDDAKAVAAYRAILAQAGDERAALAALHRIHEKRSEWKDLGEVLQRELALVPPTDPAHVALKFRFGQVCEQHLGDTAGAIGAYQEILGIDPGHEGARAALERFLPDDGHQLVAADILEPIYELLEAWPALVGVHEIQLKHEKGPTRRVALLMRIGELHASKLGDAAAAFDAYARAFREDPARPEVRGELERIAPIIESGSDGAADGWKRLVDLYEGALTRGGGTSDTSVPLDTGLLHELSLKVAAAYDERLDSTPKAIEHYRRALALEPEDTTALEALDRLFSREEKYSDLLDIYRRKVDLSHDPEERLALLFRIASLWEEMLQNPEEAITTYKEILGHDPVNLRALKALDRLYLQQRHWQDLGDNLVRQLALVSGDPDEEVRLLTRLAELREKQLKEVAAAVDTYRQVLERRPDDPTAIAALERLIGDPEHELTIAQILEGHYRQTSDWPKQIGVYEIMVRHAYDPARKIGLLHTIGELYEVGGEDTDQAFATYARALREDPAGHDTRERLERLARVSGAEKWQDLTKLYDEVIGTVQDDELKIHLLTRLAEVHEGELGQDEQAVKTHQRVLDVDPRNLGAATAIQAVHERSGDYPRLVDALKRKADIVLEVPERKSLLYKAAQIEEEILENPDAAIATYHQVLKIDEIDGPALDALERLYIQLERWPALKDIYTKKAEHAATPDERKQMLFVLGQVYDRELGDVAKAIETYQAILDLDRDDLAAIQALDRLYGQAGRWYDLLQILEREVELSESTGETVALKHRIGQLWEKELKDLTRAIEAYREALTLDPTHEPTVAALAGLLHVEGEPVLAAQVLEPIYADAGEFEKLIDVYEVMTAHADDAQRRVELLHKIAQLHETKLEHYDAAFEAYGRALRADPANDRTLGNLERLADATHAWESLARLYDAELQKILDVPRQVDLLLRLARVYEEELNRADRAIETYRRVLDVDGDNTIAIAALDRLFENAQRWPELTDILRREVRLAQSDEEVLAIEFRLGQVYEVSIKDLPAAIDVYREILTQDPQHGPTLNALELMFLDGNYQIEIAAILEPLYRDAGQWEKLHRIHEVQLGKLTEPGERQAMYQRLAEIGEHKLAEPERSFRWWGAAFGEDPRSEQVAGELERLAREQGLWAELVEVYQGVLGKRPEKDIERNVNLRVARVYDEELGDPQHAEEAYLRVLGLDAKDAEALEALDRIYEQGGMYPELADILKRRAEIAISTSDLVELTFRLGKIQSDVLGDTDAAIASYDKILVEDTRNRQALECLERIYFRREAWGKLHDVYEKMVDVARSDAEMADVYAHMARITSEASAALATSADPSAPATDTPSADAKAIELWLRVIDLRGEDPIGLSALADLYERGSEWRELVDVLQRQVLLFTDAADKVPLYKRLGRVWAEKLSRDRNALEAWLEAQALAPGDLETLHALAHLYKQTQAHEDLSQTLHRILEVGQLSGEVPEEEMVELYAQLGELEGDTLGRTGEAVEAWQRVLALAPGDFRALGALESLFTREGQWEQCIDVLERKAEAQDDPRDRIATLLQAAAMWEEKVENRGAAAQVYERVRHADPGNALASTQLESIYTAERHWDKLTEVLLERVDHAAEPLDRIQLLQQVAKIYEQQMGDKESAFVVLQAAFKEDYANESTARELERLATQANKWEDLLADYSHVVANLEHDDPDKAADLWVKIARWYGDHLSHLEYAIHSAEAARRLDPKHTGALAALADFHRKRGAYGELIGVVAQHAELEEEPQKKVELYLSLADLQETQLQDQLQAISAYQSALMVDPQSSAALSALDRLYRRNEMWEQLINVLERKATAAEDVEEQIRIRLEIGRLWDERLNEPAQAIAAFNKVRDLEPRSLAALRALERLYERTGQADAYLDVLEQELDATGTDVEKISIHNRMATAWEERFGKLDRAAEALEKILIIDERNMASYRELERLYRQDKKWDALVDTYRRHILAAGDPATRMDLYCAMGGIYEEELHDEARAIEAYTDVLSFDADEPRALEALGRLYEKIEEWDKAVDFMSRLVEVTDDTALKVDLDHRMGQIQFERLGDATAGETRFLQALSQDPTHVQTMVSLTALYKKRGDWQKAAQMMIRAEAQTQHPLEKIKLLFEAAQIHDKRLHDPARAAEYYAATIAIDPEHVEAGEPLAELYFREKRWAELEPILDMLARKAAQLKKDPKQLNELYYRVAKTADELRNNDKALKYYKLAYDLDSTYLPTLLGRGNLMFRLEDWDGAGKIYQTILVQHRESQKDTDVVEIYYRLGQVRLKLGERKKALNMFEKALEIDPAHKDTLGAVIDLQSSQGDYEAVVHAKRSLFPRSTSAEKYRLLDEIGDTYRDKLSNPQKAIAAYLEALEQKPQDHVLLHKILEVYTETKQWKKAVEVMLKFTEIETDPLTRGRYFYAAGVTSRDELKSLDDAVEYFNRALDEYFSVPDRIPADQMPKYLKAFEAIDRIVTAKKDWPNLGRAYRAMIKRMPQRKGDKIVILLWHSLGEVYRSRIKDYKAAAQAFEVASSLEPENKQRREILAELYTLAGPDYAEKAVEQHMTMIRGEPYKIDSYKALRKIYMETHQYDKAWCVCNALNFLKKADADELQFYEQYKPKGFVRAKARFTDEVWKRVFHPEQDRYVSAIFGAIWQGASLVMAFPFKAYEKQFGLKKKEQRQVETDQLLFSRVFFYVAQVLNIAKMPQVYLQTEQPGDIVLANIEEKGQLVPAFVVRSNLLQGRPEKEIAFACGKYLAYMLPEHYLKMALPTNTDLKIAFLAALVLVQPSFPIKPDQASLVQTYLPVLRSKIQPAWLEQLHNVVKRFLQNASEVDLVKWGHAVEATAHRVGFLLCGDLEVAAKMVQMEPVTVGGPQAKDKVRELVLYSISEEYFAVRQHLGTIIG